MVEHKKSNKKTNGINFKNLKKNKNFLHDQKTSDLRRLKKLKKINFLKDAIFKIHNQLIYEGTKVELLINNDLIINKQNKINIGSSNNQSIKHNVSKTIKILKKTSDPVVKNLCKFVYPNFELFEKNHNLNKDKFVSYTTEQENICFDDETKKIFQNPINNRLKSNILQQIKFKDAKSIKDESYIKKVKIIDQKKVLSKI